MGSPGCSGAVHPQTHVHASPTRPHVTNPGNPVDRGRRRRHPLARFMGRTYVILVSQNRRKYCGMSNAVATSLKVRMAAEDFAFRLGPGPSAMVKRRPHLPPAQRERH